MDSGTDTGVTDVMTAPVDAAVDATADAPLVDQPQPPMDVARDAVTDTASPIDRPNADTPAPTDTPAPIDTPRPDVPAPTDTPAPIDLPAPVDTPAPVDVAADVPRDTPPTDTGSTSACGTARPAISAITGTEGLVIGPDGTIYYSQSRYIGRLVPGGAPDNRWVSLGSAASTVWGLALDVPRHRIFAGSPSASAIFVADTTAATPTASTYLAGAGGPNGLTLGPDGALWYSDFSGGHVYRVEGAATGTRTRVTTTAISQANGVAFGADGSLYVDSYGTGRLFRLHLAANAETSRDTVATGLGNPDGLAIDSLGRFYITNQGGSRLTRLDADGSNPTTLLMGLSAPANIEFGVGALRCTDVYVATGGALMRYEMGTTPGAAVPWHRAP